MAAARACSLVDQPCTPAPVAPGEPHVLAPGDGEGLAALTGGRASASHPLDKGLGPRSGFPDRGPKPREVLLLPGFP